MIKYSKLIFILLYCFCSQTNGQNRKHLFILSGQSNMVRLDPNTSFIPALERNFGEEKIIELKNDLHLTIEGYKKLGLRFAKSAQKLIY